MAERVLFTCVGTTDTVRGLRDGGMMHAMRHYRPQKVYIFVSSEMEMLNQRDRRYEKTFRFIQEKWGGYAPEVRYNLSGIVDADDLDQVAQPMSDFFEQVVRENPQAQILINLSSGTPQMKMILAQLALNNRITTAILWGCRSEIRINDPVIPIEPIRKTIRWRKNWS